MTPLIRPARLDELEPLLAMQQRSMRLLGAPFYAREVVEAALAEMGTMDPRLIADGTYLVAELAGQIVGSAGWTMRPPNYARLLRQALPPLQGAPLGAGPEARRAARTLMPRPAAGEAPGRAAAGAG